MIDLRTAATRRAFVLLAASLAFAPGCSKSGGSRFNGGNNTTVNQPPRPTTPPTVTSLAIAGGVDPVTLNIVNSTGPFAQPVQFRYQFNDNEDDILSVAVEFARASTPTSFQTCTLIGSTNPITNLTAANYEVPGNPLNSFIWDAQTDLRPGPGGLLETVQFRIRVMDPSGNNVTRSLPGGLSFNFPVPPNSPPAALSVTAVTTNNQASGRVTLDYSVADANNDMLSVQLFYIGPILTGSTPPNPRPMTLIQVNGNPAAPVDGQAVNPLAPNTFSVSSTNYNGSVVWDSLNDIGVATFQNFVFVLQVSDGNDSAQPFNSPQVLVGNPTAAFCQNVTVVGRSGNIGISLTLFDSDSDPCDVAFEATFNGTDFIPLTIAQATTNRNVVNGAASSPTGSNLSVTWNSAADLPVGVSSGMLRISVVDNDRAATVPNSLPANQPNPNDPPLPNLFLHAGQAGFPAGTLFFLTPSVPLAGPPVLVKVRSGLNDPYYAPTLSGTFEIEGENFGTDESLVTIIINNLTQDVVEADSNLLIGRTTAGTQTGPLQVIINGVSSNTIPVLVPGNDYWTDVTPVSNSDPYALPQVSDPSVHGEFHDIDGDGDLDIVIAQDGANSILINRNLNTKLTSLRPGPYTISNTTNRFEVTILKSGINRNAGPINASTTDSLTVVGVRGPRSSNSTAEAIASTSALTTAGQIPAGQSYATTSVGYIASLANNTARNNSVGSGRLFDASVLNRRHLEILPRVAGDKLAFFETGAGIGSGRNPLGYSRKYLPSFGSSGSDELIVSSAGPFAIGDIITNNTVSAVVTRVTDLMNGQFALEITAERAIAAGQTITANGGAVSAQILTVNRNPGGVAIGGTTFGVNLPTGILPTPALINFLNEAAISAGLDVPGQIVKLNVDSTAALQLGSTVTSPSGATGVILQIADGRFLRLRSQSAFRDGEALLLGGSPVAQIRNVLRTRNDFEARLAQNGLSLDLFSDDVLVLGNSTANQALGFISTRLFSAQTPDASGSFDFRPGFQDLVVSVGDSLSTGNTPVTVQLRGVMTVSQVISAINAVGLPARLQGSSTAGRFEASLASASGIIELSTDDPTNSIHVLDQGAQRILGFNGRFVKPHARGLGNFEDETGTRLPSQGADFTTRIEVFDADEDGDPDLLESNAVAQNRLFIATRTGVFTDSTSILLPTLIDESFSVDSGDLDNDGDLDIVIANRGRNRVLENRTGDIDPNTNQPFTPGTFRERSIDVFSPTVDASSLKLSSDVAIGDLDGDGLQDIIFANLTRASGAGPVIFFSQFRSLATSTSSAPKFLEDSLNFTTPMLNLGETRRSIIAESEMILGPAALTGQNFSVSLGDVNADGRLDFAIGNEFRGSVAFQNQAYFRSDFNAVVDYSGTVLRFSKGQTIFTRDAMGLPIDSAIVKEVVPNFPGGNSSSALLVLSAFPASLQPGVSLADKTSIQARPVFQIFPNDPLSARIIEIAVQSQNPFSADEFVEFFDTSVTPNQSRGIARVVSVTFPATTANTAFIELDRTVASIGITTTDLISEVQTTAIVRQVGIQTFVSRTQFPPYPHMVIRGLNARNQSIYDYPENINVTNNTVDRRASDSSKDLVLADENGRLRQRTPETPNSLIEPSDQLDGGGNTFARIAVVANAEDRFDPVFEYGNLLFVTSDGNGSRRSAFFDRGGEPFLTSPFIVNNVDNGNEKAHMVMDTFQSFGCAVGDIDNDGDLDILFLNGGGQGQGAQNLLYSASLEPFNVDLLQAAYP